MKITPAIALVLAVTSAAAQEIRYQKQVNFGDESVSLKVSNAYVLAERAELVQDLETRFLSASDPEAKEQIARQLWEYGDGEMLYEISRAHEKRMDLVGAYAHLYALNELAKFNAKRQPPEAKVRGPFFNGIQEELEQLGMRMSPEQRRAAIRQAAQIVRDNPNCCLPM